MARALDDCYDYLSYMDEMKALSLQSKDLSQDNSFATSPNVEERKIVLQFYDDVIASEALENLRAHWPTTYRAGTAVLSTITSN